MTNYEIEMQLNQILKEEKKIQDFYLRYSKLLLQEGLSLQDALKKEKIDFEELKKIKIFEDSLYEKFFDDPDAVSIVLKKIQKTLREEEMPSSIIIPTYHKNEFKDLHHSVLIPRLKTQMEDCELISTPSITHKRELLGSMKIDSYFAQVYFQNPKFLQMSAKEEFIRIFLIMLQKMIDINLEKRTDGTPTFLSLQNNILMRNPTIEFDFIENYFTYETPFLLDGVESLEEDGASAYASAYFNEEFAKEQGINAISTIMNCPSLNFNLALHILYLQSAIVLARDNETLLTLKDFFTKNYQHDSGGEKYQMIADNFEQVDKIRSGFEYIKKTG